MASDKPDSKELAPTQDRSTWMNDVLDGTLQRRVNSAFQLESLGFPKLATEHYSDNEKTGSDGGSAVRSPDERVGEHPKPPSADQSAIDKQYRTPDERVRDSAKAWDPYESLSQPLGDPNYFSKVLNDINHYRGEPIQANVQPAAYTAKPGDTLERIAEKHLGPAATPEQIKQHAHEIAVLNRINEDKDMLPGFHGLRKGDQLTLPGHDKAGSTTFNDAQGTRFTYSTDGKNKVEYKDGTGYLRTPTNDKGYTDSHFGPKAEDRFDVTVAADGHVEKTTRVQPTKLALDNEREKLDHLADSKIGLIKERTQFKADMQAFEKRLKEQHLSPDEVAKTYKEISHLLEAEGTQPMDDRKRVRVALGIMAVAAEPTSNDQGGHNTCNVTTIENRIFTREPSTAAKLIADVATTGKYVAADGTTVKLDKGSFSTYGEEANNAARGTNERNYASQLFDVTAVNLLCVKHNESTVPPGNLRYTQERATNPKDSGERVRDYSITPPELVADSPTDAAMFNGMIDINTMITGRREADSFLSHKDSMTADDSNASSFSTKQEFEAKLLELKNAGKFPVVLGVHADNKPFYDKGPHSVLHANQVLQDGHVVLVTGYDPKTHKVTYDNQWGNSQDHLDDKPVSVDDLYNATKMVPATEWLDRLQQRHVHLSERQFAKDLETIMKRYSICWDAQSKGQIPGTVDEQQRTDALDKFSKMLKSISPARANLVRKHLKEFLEHQPDDVDNAIFPPKAMN